MTAFGLLEIQKGIFQRLSGDVTLMGMASAVYDYVPEDAVFPYVVIGDSDQQDWSTVTTAGCETETTVAVYSRSGGRKQALDIMNRIHGLLHDGAITMIGHALVQCRMDRSDVALLADGLTYHGRMVFRLLTVEV